MKNWNYISIGLSVFAIILSGYATFICDKRIEADWMSILVGILALLVTVLIGWNIYSLIDINRIRNNIYETKATLSENIETSLSEVQMTAFFVFLNKDKKSSDDIFHIWLHGISAIRHLSFADKHQECSNIAKMILSGVDDLKNTEWKDSQVEHLMTILLSMKDSKKLPEFPTLCGILWGYPALKKNRS